jgi:hypothetical protein
MQLNRQSHGDNLTGFDALYRLQNRVGKQPQIFKLIRPRMQDNDADGPAARLHLMGNSLIDGQQYFVARGFRGMQQLAVLLALKTRPLRRMRLMTSKM